MFSVRYELNFYVGILSSLFNWSTHDGLYLCLIHDCFSRHSLVKARSIRYQFLCVKCRHRVLLYRARSQWCRYSSFCTQLI